MFTLGCFCESADNAGAAAGVAAVQDQSLATSGDVITIPTLSNLIGAFGLCGATVPGNPYLDSPSLRRTFLYDISPILPLTLPSALDAYDCLPRSPIKLTPTEQIRVWDNSNPVSAEYHTYGILLADKMPTPVQGEIFTIRATAAITAVAGSWVNGNLTLSQSLPVGKYAVVGATCQGTNSVAFRLVFSGYAWRPGFMSNQLITDAGWYAQRCGSLGVWGEFDSATPPTLDLLAIAACTAQVVYLDVIKL